MLFPEMQLWLKLLLAIAVALVISLAATPIVKSFAEKVGAIDNPDEARRVHDHPIPRMGGMAIFLGFLISVVLFADVTEQVQGILIGAVIIVATGAIDDIISLRYWIKLLAQILAAVVAVIHGVVIEVVMNPNIFSETPSLLLGVLAVPITVIWIVGITNSVNLIDGLDGLACGVSTISCITMLVVALMVAEGNVAVILACLAGACIGFIPYNFNPAKIFMGDTGALLLGYVLATVSVLGMFKFYAIVTFVVHLRADTVADVIAHDGIPLGLRIVLNSRRDIGDAVACNGVLYPLKKALAGGGNEAKRLIAALAAGICPRAVSDKTLICRADIDADDIALLKAALAGYAVNDLVVYRDADAGRIAVVAQKRGLCSQFLDEAEELLVYRLRRHAGLDHLPGQGSGSGRDAARLTHEVDLLSGFYDDRHQFSPNTFTISAVVASIVG